MSTKSRGTNAERELIHKFWEKRWGAIRSAGSGSMQHPSPDILASNGKRIVAIECKMTSAEKKYFEREEIERLKEFSTLFGAEPFIAVKFLRNGWRFIKIDDLEETKKGYAIGKEKAEEKGLVFEDFISS